MTQANVGHLDRRRDAVDDCNLVAPVELVRFTGGEAERHIGVRGSCPHRLGPARGIPADGIISTVIAAPAQFLINPDECQTFPLGTAGVLAEQVIEIGLPGADLRARLHGPVITEFSRPGSDGFPHCVPGDPKSWQICLIDLPSLKCARRIFAIVSTINIPENAP